MNDFETRFTKRQKNFDRDFSRMKKWGIATSIVSLVVGLGLIGFVIWIVIMVMRFFGVI